MKGWSKYKAQQRRSSVLKACAGQGVEAFQLLALENTSSLLVYLAKLFLAVHDGDRALRYISNIRLHRTSFNKQVTICVAACGSSGKPVLMIRGEPSLKLRSA